MSLVFTELESESRGRVLWLTLNRPRAANALSARLHAELAAALTLAGVADEVGAVVLTGAGERIFSAGADVKTPSNVAPELLARRRSEQLRRTLLAMIDFDKPLVVALNGLAAGAGVFLALLADLAIAADSAALVLSEIDLGMTTFPGLTLLSERVGPGLAADLVLTGRRIPAAEAERRGLIARLAPAAELADQAQALAEQLAAKPPNALAANKRWLRGPLRAALIEALDASLAARAELLASGEQQAATAAFFAARAARAAGSADEPSRGE